MTSRETAEKIVATLFVPSNPARWGESLVSTEELIAMIAQSIDNAVTDCLAATEAALAVERAAYDSALAQLTEQTAALQTAERERDVLREALVKVHQGKLSLCDDRDGGIGYWLNGDHFVTLVTTTPTSPWSSTRPTEPGWYWLLENKPKAVPSIVRVEIEGLDSRLLIYGRLGANFITHIDGQWNGPMTPPGGVAGDG